MKFNKIHGEQVSGLCAIIFYGFKFLVYSILHAVFVGNFFCNIFFSILPFFHWLIGCTGHVERPQQGREECVSGSYGTCMLKKDCFSF